MEPAVCYIPSYNDSDRVAESLATLPEWDVVISDNASSEPHRSALDRMAGERVRIVRQEKSLGRVGNWRFCVEHFLTSGKTWLKLLCAGDLHKPNSLDIYRRAVAMCPDAGLIVPQIENIGLRGEHGIWGFSNRFVLAQPHDAMDFAARNGNVWHGFVAPLIRRDMLAGGFTFGEETLDFCADMLFFLKIAERTPTLYSPEVVATFIMPYRKSFKVGYMSMEHYMEEGLLRLRAAQAYLRLTGNKERYEEIMKRIIIWGRKGLTEELRGSDGEPVPNPLPLAAADSAETAAESPPTSDATAGK